MTITHWKIAHAQTAGRSHIKNNTPCQDFTLTMQQDGTTILLLADGAGFSPTSHIGAEAVVRKTASLLHETFDFYYLNLDETEVKKQLIETLWKEFETLEGYDGDVKQYASTLLFAAIKGDQFLAGHLGDGVIGIEAEGELKVLSFPENGQFANTTYFVTTEESWEHLRLYKGTTENITGFVLMSDGSAESLFNKREKRLAPAIKKMLEWLREHPNQKIQDVLSANLDSVIKEQTHDDCSLSIASLVKKEPEEFVTAAGDYLNDFKGIRSDLPVKSHEEEVISEDPIEAIETVSHDI
ncbi:PP2C family serine/threonine-protein phosphatase [Neobacillus dielmonensis]|uniref:PP2C family serine/threonine-protein phosphatase n=1 Tax=Neobacillus dielmonensis TaxID=1347369 RepID=UPI000693C57F|nr:PP2C family serine/threonine-protein phosphatase [Neobacillus dielmonensis]